MNEDELIPIKYIVGVILIIVAILAIIIGSFWGLGALYKEYNVWAQGKEGQAELNQAQWNRQIAVQEAQAKKDSAILLADAEIERAKGVAKANQIIGESLKQNEQYLRYLWITDVANNGAGKTVVYVPTEANLPILEANRNINK
jgi:regulator of protease activity HflC (stomatin/prohibitin superfamily)